ncbi:acyl-CoA dehydrogenase family protein [Rhodococcus opacus]|uniref:acyl-CoA dehydrogenase family protein n=1 Tax=Rhodococcus opacus TaxID=37919 RepID=UPI001C4663E7|nr:acyl-CoA dehydrogenase family protein [Rhodococcus opacus]MBV6756207.1 acyl-CoA/acyl-ACP dehydrogenase [Rhodococcus opacus]
MDFLPDTDQIALVDSTRDFIHSRFPLNLPSGDREAGAVVDDIRWKEIAELGWLGLATAEEHGGFGATLLDEAFVFREIGRALVPGPVLSTLAAARLASWTTKTDLTQRLVSGQVRVSRAVLVPGSGNTGDMVLLNDPQGSALTLLVTPTTALLSAAPTDVELSPGIEDDVMVGRTTASALGETLIRTDDTAVVSALSRVLSILTSAQLAGNAAATRDLATEHAKARVQFGKPIGAFQAIKHRCADMAINAHAAENVMFLAALTESQAPSGRDFDALAAAVFCRRAAFDNAQANIQIHGAMGFTVESPAHRFLKRAHSLSGTEGFGSASFRLAAQPRQ